MMRCVQESGLFWIETTMRFNRKTGRNKTTETRTKMTTDNAVIQKLEAENLGLRTELENVLIRNEETVEVLKEEVKRLREALGHYAKDIRLKPDGPLVPNLAKDVLEGK